jgi:hypothetical protein
MNFMVLKSLYEVLHMIELRREVNEGSETYTSRDAAKNRYTFIVEQSQISDVM